MKKLFLLVLTLLLSACSSHAAAPDPAPAELPVQSAQKAQPGAYADVPGDAYYAEAVRWAVAQGVTKGTGPDTFSPADACTRGQIVTFLHRAAGAPAPSGGAGSPFADVSSGAYYAGAVGWAVENSVTRGTAADRFSPDTPCTRGQIVTFLHRAARTDSVRTKPAPGPRP